MMYSVSLFFSTSPVEPPAAWHSWEEQILLIEADSDEEAKNRAEEVGRRRELQYENAEGTMVSTKFVCVERVFQISGELTTGCEVFSRFLRDCEAQSLLQPFDD